MPQERTHLELPADVPITDKEEEKILLRRLKQDQSDPDFRNCLYALGFFYNRVGRNDLALDVIQTLVKYCDAPEERALYYLTLGQLSEQERQYPLAIHYYTQGLNLGPKGQIVGYFLRNNLGACLNREGRHQEGETFCLAAIEIDSDRANAFRNLGISLRGQGDIVGAAWACAEATRIDPSETQAQRLLRRLVAEHPKVLSHLVHAFLKQSPTVT